MKSSSNTSASSCLWTFVAAFVAGALIRFIMPGLWRVVLSVSQALFYFGIVIVAIAVGVGIFLTYRNYQENEKKRAGKGSPVLSKTEELYSRVINKLQTEMVLNQVSADEMLQAEILMSEKLPETRTALIRLEDFASPENQKRLQDQLNEYQQKLSLAKDPAVQEVMEENIKMLEEKKMRMSAAVDEVKQKQATLDLIHNSLTADQEELSLGKPLTRIFPDEIYRYFGLNAPTGSLPPLSEKSSVDEADH